MNERILVAGIGNIFLGDDAFGVEVVQHLISRAMPGDVRVVDFGIRAFDLAYAMLEPWEVVILLDTTSRGGAPGTLYTIEIDPGSIEVSSELLNPHGMDPVKVLQLATSIGPVTARIYVVGCEPLDFGEELEGRMGLSTVVQSVIPNAAQMVEDLCQQLLSQTPPVQAGDSVLR
jgi:hydrogenase maturation protease